MNYIKNINKEDKKVFVALSPDYANIGDIAINIVQNQILTEIFPDRKIVEIPLFQFYDYKSSMEELLNDDDIITIIGGGNMGNIWLRCEETRRDLIKTFPNNKIVSFPQSIDFENNEIGQKEFKTTIDIYKKHPNLTIFSREQKSYDIMKNNFENEVYLVPDTVMYSAGKITNQNIDRDKISLCFRNDKEKVTSQNIIEQFVSLLEKIDIRDIEIFDTVIENLKFEPDEKETIWKKTLDKFRSSKVVITDRLHGMIFALITKTPCIALDNSNKKISSTYFTWLTDVPYIKLLNHFDEEKIIEYINDFQKIDIDSIYLDYSSYFEPLYKKMKGDS